MTQRCDRTLFMTGSGEEQPEAGAEMTRLEFESWL